VGDGAANAGSLGAVLVVGVTASVDEEAAPLRTCGVCGTRKDDDTPGRGLLGEATRAQVSGATGPVEACLGVDAALVAFDVAASGRKVWIRGGDDRCR
jgi:hypothetical protein